MDPFPHDPDGLGFKANMNDIVATLACSAMDYLDTALSYRKYIGDIYRRELGSLKKIQLMNYKEDRKPNYQIFPVHVDDREKFTEFMWNKGIQVNINNRRNDIYSIFGGLRNDLPSTKRVDEDVILIPLHSDLTTSQVEKIVNCIMSYDDI